LEHVLRRSDVSDIAVFTHAKTHDIEDIALIAEQNGLFCSTESINKADLPFKPDIIASVYYRYIIKPRIIDLCEGRIFNMHPSLLPRHRGCSSIPWAIIDGDSHTGVTFHYINHGIDTGKIILQTAVQISPVETQLTLFRKCMERGVKFWPAAFELVKAGFSGVEQEGEPSYHKRICPYNGSINENWPLDKIERFIRAMIFPPYPCATYKGKAVKTMDEYLKLSQRHV